MYSLICSYYFYSPSGLGVSSSLAMLLLGDSLRDARYKSPWKRPWFTRQSSLGHKAMKSR